MKHYTQFAVLRGFASVWVYVGHALMIAGLSFSFFPSAELAVELFMILSGFVITLLRTNKPEPYNLYIFRRLMRLYPLFLIALALGYMTMHLYLPVLGQSPLFPGDPQKFMERDSSVDQFFFGHLIAHLTMLHGAVPDSQLPQSALAISGPLWSISLEWQFYLIAPFIIFGIDWRNRRITTVLASIGIIALISWVLLKYWTPGIVTAFLPQKIQLFILGVVCGIAWESTLKRHYWELIFGAVFTTFVYAYCLHCRVLPIAIWFCIYITAATGSKTLISNLGNRILNSSIATWIGDRSYGIYVLHMPIMLLVAYYLALPHAHEIKRAGVFLVTVGVSTPIVLLLSAISYKFVEMPTIAWAKKLKGVRSREIKN